MAPTITCPLDHVKETFLLVIDKDQKQRECIPAIDLRINGKHLKTLEINDACQYLSYWGTGKSDMSATREVVCSKRRMAHNLIKSHPPTS